jgi:hypothetical protein
MLTLNLPLRSVWDLGSGECISVHTGSDAEQQRQAAEAWRDARTSGYAWAPTLKDDAVELVDDGVSRATVYLMPPMRLWLRTLHVTDTRLAAFTTGNVFVLYELNVRGAQGGPAACLYLLHIRNAVP